MIAVWIIGTIFTLVGGLYALPKYIKIFRCNGRTTGRIINTRSTHGTDNQSISAQYEYYVDGVRYVANTGWTTLAHFSSRKEYTVRYNSKKPEVSFINMSGIYFNCALGTVFFLVGIGAFGIGILLSYILHS